MKVNICGIEHRIVECDDKFDNTDLHLGQINYGIAEIRINKDLSYEMKKETLCHEMLHGILMHLGYDKEGHDEQFVQAVANAINEAFVIKVVE